MIFLNPFSQNFRTPINVLAILQFEVVRIDSFKLIMMSVGWGEKWIGVGKYYPSILAWGQLENAQTQYPHVGTCGFYSEPCWKIIPFNVCLGPTRKCPNQVPSCRDMWILFLNHVGKYYPSIYACGQLENAQTQCPEVTVWNIFEAGTSLDLSSTSVTCKPLRWAGTWLNSWFWFLTASGLHTHTKSSPLEHHFFYIILKIIWSKVKN